jgi:hypothetical protein
MAHSDHGDFREELHGEHPHSYDHTEPKYSLLWIIGATIVILLIAVGIGIQMYWERVETSAVYERVLSQENWNLQHLRNSESKELSTYGYVDQKAGTVRIPLDQAIRLTIEEAASGKTKYPTNAYAVKTDQQLQASQPGVSPQGAAAAAANQKTGITSSPDVQQPARPQQPNK